ncbi:hypothetical protein AB5I41_20325 [Sphingomonas sp. MMS24-JH45]
MPAPRQPLIRLAASGWPYPPDHGPRARVARAAALHRHRGHLARPVDRAARGGAFRAALRAGAGARLGRTGTMLANAWRSVFVVADRRAAAARTCSSPPARVAAVRDAVRAAPGGEGGADRQLRALPPAGVPSFARLAGRIAHVRIAQAAESARNWPGALLFDPFRAVSGRRPTRRRCCSRPWVRPCRSTGSSGWSNARGPMD